MNDVKNTKPLSVPKASWADRAHTTIKAIISGGLPVVGDLFSSLFKRRRYDGSKKLTGEEKDQEYADANREALAEMIHS